MCIIIENAVDNTYELLLQVRFFFVLFKIHCLICSLC